MTEASGRRGLSSRNLWGGRTRPLQPCRRELQSVMLRAARADLRTQQRDAHSERPTLRNAGERARARTRACCQWGGPPLDARVADVRSRAERGRPYNWRKRSTTRTCLHKRLWVRSRANSSRVNKRPPSTAHRTAQPGQQENAMASCNNARSPPSGRLTQRHPGGAPAAWSRSQAGGRRDHPKCAAARSTTSAALISKPQWLIRRRSVASAADDPRSSTRARKSCLISRPCSHKPWSNRARDDNK